MIMCLNRKILMAARRRTKPRSRRAPSPRRECASAATQIVDPTGVLLDLELSRQGPLGPTAGGRGVVPRGTPWSAVAGAEVGAHADRSQDVRSQPPGFPGFPRQNY